MPFFHRIASAAVVIALAGCSAGSHSTLPSQPPADTASGARAPMSGSGAGPSVSGTLYLATVGSVYAVPLSSNGTVSASRTITPHPEKNNHDIEGIATQNDGKLAVLDTYFTGPNQDQSHCRVVVFASDANGSAALDNVPCDVTDLTQSGGIASNPSGAFDVLYVDQTTSKFVIRRFSDDNGTIGSTLVLGPPGLYLATDAQGRDYIDTSSGEIVKYKSTTTDQTIRAADFTISSPDGDGPIVVAPDKTIYFVHGESGTAPSIDAVAPGGTTVSRTIGPFGESFVTALAVDSQGELYVALEPRSGGQISVRVYAANANGKPPALRTIALTQFATELRGMAISESTASTPIPTSTPTSMPTSTPTPIATPAA